MNYIQKLTAQEFDKQKNTLNLIASENYPSPAVLNLLGSVWSNKYGEGYPSKRFYAGNQFTDKVEDFACQKALEVFDKTGEYGVNVQTLSGSPANQTVYIATLEYGDTILSPELSSGGHLTHMHQTSSLNKFFKPILYHVKENTKGVFEIDIDDFKQKIASYKPKLVIIGFSAYPLQYQFGEMCEFAHHHGSLVMADIAHINGLVAANLHDSPFKSGAKGADFITMTTHKTFRGPRGAMLFAKNYTPEWATKLIQKYNQNQTKSGQVNSLIGLINRNLFPGGFGGPHFNKIASIGQACLEVLDEDRYPDNKNFTDYSKQVLANTKALENCLNQQGLEIISPTENHLCLIKIPREADSLKIQNNLEELGIITNRNKIPFDTRSAWKPSGFRFGMAALTSRGIRAQQIASIGEIIAQVIFSDSYDKSKIKYKIQSIAESLNWYYKL